jgi:uncharacterized protein YaaN involved in tellurite resistance
MAFRRIPHKDRVNAILECIEIKNVKEIAKKYKISEATLASDCKDLLKGTDEMLKKRSLVGRLREKLKSLYQKLV